MPCYDPEASSPSYIRGEAFKEFRHNSDVAEMLCALCTKYAEYFGNKGEPYPVTQKDALDQVHKDLFKWWQEHKARDAAVAAQKAQALKQQRAEAEAALATEIIYKKYGLKKR